MLRIDHIQGQTFHGRRGAIANAFRYSIDYVLLDAEQSVVGPALFGRNGYGIASLHDQDHGGVRKNGRGAAWVREVLAAWKIEGIARIELLAQPRFWGHVFNPVSFWLCRNADGALIAVIAEVSNTFGDRHNYLVYHPDQRPITAQDRLTAHKIFHVSPFQPVEGEYEFRFDITDARVGIWINYSRTDGGLIATLTGTRAPLSNLSILRAALRRPFGSRRVLALIHWQALKLWAKRATYRARPVPPAQDVSQ